MTFTQQGEPRFRLWPGVVAVVLQWLLWLGIPLVAPEMIAYGMVGGILGGGLAVLIWWLFFSRVPRIERWAALVVMLAAATATRPILHPSITGGMMGMMFGFFVVPTLCLALVTGAVASRRFSAVARRATMAVAIVAGCAVWALMRTDGITGEGRSQLAWRWAKTPEQKLLAKSAADPVAQPQALAKPTPATDITPSAEVAVAPPAAIRTLIPAKRPPSIPTAPQTDAEWPGFRGAHRDDVITGVRINTDWTASPPVQLWRRPVGPGWSSFAVGNGLIYTQEQRGEFEVVSCYNIVTGEPVWTHRDAARFWESNGGAGPRGTPTLDGGRIYTFGATGILNALDASDGRVIWTRNAGTDTGAKVPEWAFSSSPLLVNDAVIVAASGRLIAYDRATGDPRWHAPSAGGSYSSPQLVTIDAVAQILLMTSSGVTSFAPSDGNVLWKHAWSGAAILQPALTADGGVLITSGDMSGGMGTRRLAVAREGGGWTAKEVWTSTGLKPYFNDFVVHDGHAFGFDGGILACIDLQDGKRIWKGGRYGHGQLLLLADQDMMLVTSEEGELALVAAVPGQFTEVARFAAMEGKTWNHPVLAGNILLVRNGQEMVAYRLALAGS